MNSPHPSAHPTTPFTTLGLDEAARARLAEVTGGKPNVFYLQTEQMARWPASSNVASLERREPMFITTSWSVVAPEHAHRDDDNPPRWHLASGVWIDLDAHEGNGVDGATAALRRTADMLLALDIKLDQCSLFATGGRGYHIYIPLALMVPGGAAQLGPHTMQNWGRICHEFVRTSLLTDEADLTMYPMGRGKLIRQAGVQRRNGAFKVPVAWADATELTSGVYAALCSTQRFAISTAPVVDIALKAAAAWAAATRSVCKPTSPARKQRPHSSHGGRTLPDPEKRRVLSMLSRLSLKDLPYVDWIRVGSALKSTDATDALEIWTTWSEAYPKYRQGECEARWSGLNGLATLGTLAWLSSKRSSK